LRRPAQLLGDDGQLVPCPPPQRSLKIARIPRRAIRDGGGDLGQVVDEQTVGDPVPATPSVVTQSLGDAGRQRGEQRCVPVRDQLDALEVTEHHPFRPVV